MIITAIILAPPMTTRDTVLDLLLSSAVVYWFNPVDVLHFSSRRFWLEFWFVLWYSGSFVFLTCVGIFGKFIFNLTLVLSWFVLDILNCSLSSLAMEFLASLFGELVVLDAIFSQLHIILVWFAATKIIKCLTQECLSFFSIKFFVASNHKFLQFEIYWRYGCTCRSQNKHRLIFQFQFVL